MNYYLVLPSFTEFYRVLQSFTEFREVLPSFMKYCRVSWSITKFYRVLSSASKFHRVLSRFTEFCRVFNRNRAKTHRDTLIKKNPIKRLEMRSRRDDRNLIHLALPRFSSVLFCFDFPKRNMSWWWFRFAFHSVISESASNQPPSLIDYPIDYRRRRTISRLHRCDLIAFARRLNKKLMDFHSISLRFYGSFYSCNERRWLSCIAFYRVLFYRVQETHADLIAL